MGEIMNPHREWNQVFLEEWAFPAPHVVPVTIKKTESQSYGEHTIQHMIYRSVKYVNKVCMTISFSKKLS